MMADRIRKIAQIGRDRNLDAFGAEGKSHGIGGVMRDGETGDVDIADGEARAGLEHFERRHVFAPGNGGGGQARKYTRECAVFGRWPEAGDVVGVLVGDENRGERLGVDARGVETLEGFFAGEARVDEETGPLRGDQGGVAGARGRENRDFDDRGLLE